ncbi:DUF7504 family protein [Halobellus rufus]|uniref:DUF7504 family protein n=1 Tax=Halobellus rufus TaxID=1448860 RepID=UPI00067981DF|nr:hypothetical protein [Halobellus rufus]
MSSIAQVAAQVDDAATVLFLRPQAAAVDDAECKRQFVDGGSDTTLLGISFSQPPAAWFDSWCEILGGEPAAAALITTPELASGDLGDRDLDVETVASPSNLTGVGVKSTPYLSEWDDATVTVESLTVLLQYADTQSVYRFLHVLTTRLRAADATGYFYLDPSVVDDRTVELLKTLFDAVVECDVAGDGESVEWTARIRAV